MAFLWKITVKRMSRQKIRLALALLAIAASSCLIVWTIGGFQALFMDETVAEANYLGRYDLRIAPSVDDAKRGGGGNFAGPFGNLTREEPTTNTSGGAKDSSNVGAKSSSTQNQGDETKVAEQSRAGRSQAPEGERAVSAEEPGAGRGRGAGGARRGGRGRGDVAQSAFAPELIEKLRRDEQTILCDQTFGLQCFVYSPNSERSILEDDDLDPEGKPTTKRTLDLTDEQFFELAGRDDSQVDAQLRRKAFGAYRATMGTPMGLGSKFYGITATEAPYELKDGRWFASANDSLPAYEAVLTQRGVEQFKAQVGDDLFLIAKKSLADATSEFQLKVVGIVDDPETEGFYVSAALAREIAEALGRPLTPTAIYLKTREAPEIFRERWRETFAALAPTCQAVTAQEVMAQKLAQLKDSQSFKYQASSGAFLAALASLLIVFVTLNTSFEEQKRLFAFYRASGLTRAQTATSILMEGTLLALPGWLGGVFAGQCIIWICSGKARALSVESCVFSFICVALGAVVASLYPMLRSARLKPIEAIRAQGPSFYSHKTRRRQNKRFVILALLGVLCVSLDIYTTFFAQLDTARKASLHCGFGLLALAMGTLFLIPLTSRVTEWILTPILARVLAIDAHIIRSGFTGDVKRVAAVAAALSVGGGLFVSMQIWGYSMLDPFLPGRRAPEAFVAFLPDGLCEQSQAKLKGLPMLEPDQFLPVAVEQAAFAQGSIDSQKSNSPFANVVFFGVDVAQAFGGDEPMVGVYFRQGERENALIEMQTGRGVIVTDSLMVDYGLKVGDTLKTTHPRRPTQTLEYPIVGVVSFPGWQWLSKTGGVRRNFGRSGGVVFARRGIIENDYQIERYSYFWFNLRDGVECSYSQLEGTLDALARENLALDLAQTQTDHGARTAYAKLSTRESLTRSISRRADKVIWGLSKTPITTLVIAAIAAVGAIANSTRSRRWQFGIMRALGLTRWTLARAILIEAIQLATVTSLTSFGFGYLAARASLKLGKSMFGTVDPPVILPVKGLTFGLALTFVLCITAALYPAIKTARTDTLRLLQTGRAPE
ncbi:MAG: ABC transporter permease [Planctomycetia bacterium]|nr:ABC transporter permease [Planctomycetia bacterium]